MIDKSDGLPGKGGSSGTYEGGMVDPNTTCAGMGCKHPRKSHAEWGKCSEKKAFYNEHMFGYDQPLIYKTCMCPWMEPIPPSRIPVRDEPQA